MLSMIFIKRFIPFGTIFIILSVFGCSSEAEPDGQAKANDISVYFQFYQPIMLNGHYSSKAWT